MTAPTTLDLILLPENLRNNWGVLLSVRSSAQTEYAGAIACEIAGPVNSSDAWVKAFDAAAAAWLAVNPMEPHWAAGKWPAGADEFLGNDAITQARKLLFRESV